MICSADGCMPRDISPELKAPMASKPAVAAAIRKAIDIEFLIYSIAFPQGMPIQNGLIVQPSPIMYITDLSTVFYEHA